MGARKIGSSWLTAAVLAIAVFATSASAAPLGSFHEYSTSSRTQGVAAGADGNLWFTESGSGGSFIARSTPGGSVTEFPVAFADPGGIALGPDGNIWYTAPGDNKIGRIAPDGAVAEFPIPTSAASPETIAAGPDGNLWFTEYTGDNVGRITPAAGTITEYPLPTASAGPRGIATGADGALWFAEANADQIGRITPASKTISEMSVPTAASTPSLIAPGSDGNLWFTEYSANKVASIGSGASAASLVAPVVSGSGQAGTPQVCGGDAWADWAGSQPALAGIEWLATGPRSPGRHRARTRPPPRTWVTRFRAASPSHTGCSRSPLRRRART